MEWQDVCSLPTAISEKAFWVIAEIWAQNPQHLMKPAKKFYLTAKKYYSNSTLLHTSSFTSTNEEIGAFTPDPSITIDKIEYHRHLIPRLVEKDNELDEVVVLDYTNKTLVLYPIFPYKPEPLYLPYFYPKVLQFSISYQPITDVPSTNTTTTTTTPTTQTQTTDPQLPETTPTTNKAKQKKSDKTTPLAQPPPSPIATLSMRAQFFDETTFKNTMKKVGMEVLEKLNKWGTRNEAPGGYKKLANYDVVVPRDLYFSIPPIISVFFEHVVDLKGTYERLKQKYKNWAEMEGPGNDDEGKPSKGGKDKKGSLWRDAHGGLDPSKYVFEEIGIAAYLVALWEIERKEKNTDKLQSFVDVGCGNGFLLNILLLEGHPGLGVDLRLRKMWANYDQSVQDKLVEEAIMPESTVYDVDWVVANHSDELTPWIPFIASRSPEARFFVIPCCFYDFNCKFNKNDLRIGQYKTYLNYVEHIGTQLGFVVEKDTLRIPSTKNIALMGRKRVECDTEKAREKLLAASGYTTFVPRPKVQPFVPQKRIKPGSLKSKTSAPNKDTEPSKEGGEGDKESTTQKFLIVLY